MTNLRGVNEHTLGELRENVIKLRALERRNLGDSVEAETIRSSIEQAQNAINQQANGIGDVARQKADIESGINTKNRMAFAGIGLPGVAGLAYGYEGFKEQ
jgi:hypothetical protein